MHDMADDRAVPAPAPGDRRGSREERGYHNLADPWKQQRHSYEERAGDGPEPVR